MLSLVVRVPELGAFTTVDEPRWIARSQEFVGGLLFTDYKCPPTLEGQQFAASGWACTFQAGHPGVTTMWGGSLGLLAYYWQVVRPAGVDVRTFLQDLKPLDSMLIAPSRLPLAVLAALFVSLFYVLLRRLLGERVALVSALLLALSPFHIALSRVLHHDGTTTAFMGLSLLAMIGYWLQGWRKPWLFVSAVMAGLAFLSKSVGWFMIPCAGALGLLSLYYRWQTGQWRGWFDVWRLAQEGILWAVVAGLTFVALFPAMWVSPAQVIRGMIDMTIGYVQEGHATGQYFLGRISHDPGPFFYPIGWLLRASPLETLGLLVLPVAAWRTFRQLHPVSLRQQVIHHPTQVALAFFLTMFLLFETASGKKMVRYFLPAFPVIDVFVALGLLWLWDSLTKLVRNTTLHRRGEIVLSSLILLTQGWLVLDNYPYYFTYYNPLLGGAPGAGRLIGVGWGEGMNEAAAYLNQQPGAESLQVAAAYHLTFIPFFSGETIELSNQVTGVINSDYLVYYRHQLQRRLQDMDVWRYFEKHYLPVYRVTLQGLDYALVYRNPIQNHVHWQDNSLPDTFRTFGYNLAADGTLTLFWQNLGLKAQQELWMGLAPAIGGETRWVACTPVPAFAAELDVPGAILESLCPLSEAGPSPDFYDLRLGLSDGQAISAIEFPDGRLALSVDSTGHFAPVDQATALELLKEWKLVTPLDISFGGTARWVGYQLEPATWQPGSTGVLHLYWEMNRKFDLSLVNAFQLVLRLVPDAAPDSVLSVTSAVLPQPVAARDVAAGAVVSARYLLSLPATLSQGQYSLDVCLTVTGDGQPVTGVRADTSEPVECLPLPVILNSP
jgi:4-amino-4-deoxy-L-arabinose transferase-like glycosyltransferase